MVLYTRLTAHTNKVYNQFQNLSKDINSAAIINPDLLKQNAASKEANLFFTDSRTVHRDFNHLKATVKDSVNIRIAEKLGSLIKSELSWIISSNVPDSMIRHTGGSHISSLHSIDSLIGAGLDRTKFLLLFHQQNLDSSIEREELLMILFIGLSTAMLLYTVINLSIQKSKTKQKEHELETAFNRINDSVISLDTDWAYTFLNEAALVQYPGGKTEVLGKRIWDVHPEMKTTVLWDKYHEAMLTKKVVEIETFYEPRNTWFFIKIYPSQDGITIFYKNISEQKEAELALSKTLKELSDYKFALDEASIVSITDQKGIIRHVNENFCKISKYSAAELEGRDHRIVNSGFHPNDFIKNLWTTIGKGKIWKGELKNKAKDGSMYWVDTTIVPFLDNNGKPYQYVAIRSDITERKKAALKLQAAMAQQYLFTSIVTSSEDAIISKTLDGIITTWNKGAEKIFGYDFDEMIGKSIYTIIPERLSHEEALIVSKIMEGQYVEHYETERIKKDGTVINVSLTVSPILDAEGQITGASKIARDITAQKYAEVALEAASNELARSNKELEQFAYVASHDLQEPLRMIAGFLTQIEKKYADVIDETGKTYIGFAVDGAKRMRQIILDLLEFSRVGNTEDKKEDVDTQNMVADIMSLFRKQVEDKRAQIAAINLPVVHTFKMPLYQVFQNLISNALKYADAQSPCIIQIRASDLNTHWQFAVSDNGIGIDPQYFERIFVIFQRLHSKDSYAGTGLGLAITKKIIDHLGGRIWVESAESEGSTFYFTIKK